MPLTSSAVSGKKAAPKAPARRRPVAAIQAVATDADPGTADRAVIPPTPPSTQIKFAPEPATTPCSPAQIEQNIEISNEIASATESQENNNPISTPSLDDAPTNTATEAASPSLFVGETPDEAVSHLEPSLAAVTGLSHANDPQPIRETVSSHDPQDLRADRVLEDTRTSDYGQLDVNGNGQPQVEQDRVESSVGTLENESQTRPHEDVTSPATTNKRARQRKEEATNSNPRPTKKAKKSSVRSNNIVQTNISGISEGPGGTITVAQSEEAAPARQLPQPGAKGRKRTPKSSLTQKRTKKRRADACTGLPNSAARDGQAAAGEDESVDVQRQHLGASQEEGDEDPEIHQIDPVSLSMFALSHDTVNGKTSEREKKMAAIDWNEVARKRKEEATKLVASSQQQSNHGIVSSIENADETAENGVDGEDLPNRSGNVQFTVDAAGNIVADESSLRINRHEEVEAAERRGDTVEDDNDLTVRINRACWVNSNRRDPADRVPMWKSKSDPWSETDTDKFYDALRMFGTDFDIISKMFPGKTRRHVKLKFTREEKLDPSRLNNALMGKETRTMNLEHYARATGNDVSIYTKYDGVEHAISLIAASMTDKQEAMAAAATEEALLVEKQRQEREKQKAAEKKSAKKTKKGRVVSSGLFGGEPEEDE